MRRTIIVEIIAILFMILFLYSGITKVMDYTLFKEQVATSPLLEPVASLIAWWLPMIEFVVVILLFVPRWRLKGLYVSFVLMLLFTGYIIALLSFSKHIPCSCGGIIELFSWKEHIIFNGIFAGLGLTGMLFEKKIKKEYKLGLT